MTFFFKKWKRYFTFAAVLSCFVNILQLTFPFYMFAIYQNIIVSYSKISLANITAAAFFAVLSLGFFSYVRSRLLALAGKELNLLFRSRIYSLMVKASVIDNKQAYREGINDLELLKNYFSSPAVYGLFDVPWTPFYLGLIYLFHPVLGLIATLGAVVMVALNWLQEILVRRSMQEANITFSRNQRFVDSVIRNAEVVNGMGMIGAVSTRFIRGNNLVMINQTISSNHAGTIQAAIKPLQNVIQVLIYCAGAYYAITEGFDVGLMVAAAIIMGRGLAPLMQVASSWQFTSRAMMSYKRLKGFSDILERLPDTMPLPPPTGHIYVAGVAFRAGDQVLLDGISFELNKGELLGIIGPSGAGKTTLCRMLCGGLPSAGGKVYLDGKDIFSWDKEEIGSLIGYLPQEIELFPETVAGNIARLGKQDMELIKQALEICGMQDMVDGFPKGLQTIIEDKNGIMLSGGQRQKIGLVRAVYGKPNLLVLDEPTSNLDEHGEQQVLNILNNLKRTRTCTCIMVTHKPSLLQAMDKILVLTDGRVAMFGSRDTIFAKLALLDSSQKPAVL